jgi:hypothetical protein
VEAVQDTAAGKERGVIFQIPKTANALAASLAKAFFHHFDTGNNDAKCTPRAPLGARQSKRLTTFST